MKFGAMMHMTFYFGVDVTLWFDAWKSDSLISYMFMLIGVSLFAVAHEGLHRLRQCCSAAVVSRYDGMGCTSRVSSKCTRHVSMLIRQKDTGTSCPEHSCLVNRTAASDSLVCHTTAF